MADLISNVPLGSAARTALRHEVEEFLIDEADLLDQWRLEEWLDLFTEDGCYIVPSTEVPDGDPASEQMFAHDNMLRLRGRVTRLMSRRAFREFPFARTRHIDSNVKVVEESSGELSVRSNFIVYRSRRQQSDMYVGEHIYRLRRTGEGLRIAYRRSNLDMEMLSPHGTVSIIL